MKQLNHLNRSKLAESNKKEKNSTKDFSIPLIMFLASFSQLSEDYSIGEQKNVVTKLLLRQKLLIKLIVVVNLLKSLQNYELNF